MFVFLQSKVVKQLYDILTYSGRTEGTQVKNKLAWNNYLKSIL